jgi:serine/threonine protein kinase
MDTCTHCGEPSGSGRFCSNCGIARAPGAVPSVPLAAAPSLWQPLPVGLCLQGRYIVGRLISRGSFGAVYEVADGRFAGQRRALKELVPVVLTAEEFSEAKTWFLREAEMLGDLNHPAIPRVWDSFEEHGRLYICMQYVEGCSLDDMLADAGGRGLPALQVLGWARALCDVLGYLHGHRPPVLFRDLKPANIMLDQDSRLMLIDFGIATRFAPQRIGTTIGTPGYAPPEQYQGLAEPRSDLYALGATVHHLLTGRDPARQPPFSFPPLDPGALGIPPILARAISDTLSFQMSERPGTVAEFRKALTPREARGPERAPASRLVRSDLRHASRVANQPWSAQQRELAEAHIPVRVAALRRQSERQPGVEADEESVALRVQALWQEAGQLAAVGHYARAVGTLEQAISLLPESVDLWREKGRMLRQAGRPAEAITSFREALRLDPEQPDILSSLGWCLAHNGNHAEALGVLEKALVCDPFDAAAWAAKGWSLACQRRLHEALRALDEATELDPGNAEAWRTRGYCLERLGLEIEAMRSYQRAQRAG